MLRFLVFSLLGIVLAAGPLEVAWAESNIPLSVDPTANEPATPSGPADAASPAEDVSKTAASSGSNNATSPAEAANEPATTSSATDATAPAAAANESATQSGATSSTARAEAANEPATLYNKIAPNVPGLRLTGALGVWGRGFFERPEWDGQRNTSLWPYVEGWVKAEYTWNKGNDRFNFMPFGRKDFYGSQSLVDIKEGYFLHVGDGWSVLAGINTVRWGVVESRHLVNIINQVDYAWNLDGDEVLGQPMANINVTTPAGTLSLYGLFGFRPLHEPEVGDRLRAEFVSTDRTILANDIEKNINFAGRFSSTFSLLSGSVDAAISYFHGVGREPRYIMVVPPTPMTAVPQISSYYDLIDQGGLEVVATFDALQLKFEGIIRRELGETYGATVAGFEYTFYNVANSGADIGLVAEHLTDNRSALQPATVYAHSVFAGGRLSLNEGSNTQFLGGILYNYEDMARYATAKFSTRLRDDLGLALEGRYLIYAPPEDYLYSLLHDSYVQARITKYF